ncbi:carbohydrate ABC transporter permease [Pseudonocardia alni]|uniref:carbohydrate ABC transporter permease n=1 Tax=Pseudonocardia TaxID=1847 RepID=UPI002096CAD1|nr:MULTISPECIES: sugar ABC transporter permease [Pseudonocardia]MCO7192062.1 sugar ABC transporter permease [Pseudonocardia sp. McavD-2-B]WFG47251.1 sugar ABC transporter permease [Pseudonocardia alni]
MTSTLDRAAPRARAAQPGPRGRPWLYLVPLVLALGVWVYGPLLWTGVLSLLDWNLISPNPEFVGVDNFVAVFGRPETTNALVRTGYYVLGMLPFATVIPMTLAILLWRRPGRAADGYRALLFSPVVLAPVATAISWQFLLSPQQGLVNTVLSGVGLPAPNWLGDPRTALPVIVLVTAGKIVALNMLLFSAALAGVDRRAIDAARIDGATEWETTRFIVLPQMLRTIALLSALCVIVAGQWVFTNVAALTRGGPDGATDNIYYRLYTEGFDFFDAGSASALAVAITLALALLFGAAALWNRRRSRA